LVRDCTTWGLSATCLRYFNVAGAATPELGDPGARNLIPLVFRAPSRGERPVVFGDDYPTPDGTCIRDYVHVADIADAHVVAARALQAGGAPPATSGVAKARASLTYSESGEVTGTTIEHDVLTRRSGDPARVVASAEKIRTELGCQAVHDLGATIESAWAAWPRRH